jgi:hypothetical protein
MIQFDNLRRVFKLAEGTQGELVALIAGEFALHEALARSTSLAPYLCLEMTPGDG